MSIFDHVDKTNHEAYEFFKKNENKIHEICQPFLDNHKIDIFLYFKVLPNGYGITVSSHLDVVYKSNLEYLSKEGVLHPGEFKKTFTGKSHYFMWSRRDLIPGYAFPPATGINIHSRGVGQYEGFVYANRVSSPELFNFFLNKLKELEKFGEIFKYQARELIKMDNPQKLVWVRNANLLELHKEGNQVSQKKEYKMLKQLLIRDANDKEITLTKRETQCMILLCKGKKTAKEMAKTLRVSPRTIEKYLHDIKMKFGYHLWSDIIKAFGKNALIWDDDDFI